MRLEDTWLIFRDKRQKVYVQDVIREQAKVVYHAIAVKQGLVYICGYVLDAFGEDYFNPEAFLFGSLMPVDELC